MDTINRRAFPAPLAFLSGSYSPAREAARALGGRVFWEPVSDTIRTVPHGILIAHKSGGRWQAAADPEVYRLAPEVTPEQLTRVLSRFLDGYPALQVALLSELFAPGLEPLRQAVWEKTPAGLRQEGAGGLRWVLYLDPLLRKPELMPLAYLGRARLLNLLEPWERAAFEPLGLLVPDAAGRCRCGAAVAERWTTGQPWCTAGHGPFRTEGVES